MSRSALLNKQREARLYRLACLAVLEQPSALKTTFYQQKGAAKQ
jgi:hypothetical protein